MNRRAISDAADTPALTLNSDRTHSSGWVGRRVASSGMLWNNFETVLRSCSGESRKTDCEEDKTKIIFNGQSSVWQKIIKKREAKRKHDDDDDDDDEDDVP